MLATTHFTKTRRRLVHHLMTAAAVVAVVASAAAARGGSPAGGDAPTPAVAKAGFVPLPASFEVASRPRLEAPAALARAADDAQARLAALAPDLDSEVLRLALAARDSVRARGLAARPELLTVIDYSRPSSRERLWVFDVERGELLFHELVAHGKNTGDHLARRFSNREGSLQTSLGVFVTADTYHGSNGYSLRLRGLEPGVNDQALPRAIVMHGAPYVSKAFVSQHGRIGRSWGCPAVSQQVARDMIDTLKGGSVVFSYYPDQQWLGGSSFLGSVRAAR